MQVQYFGEETIPLVLYFVGVECLLIKAVDVTVSLVRDNSIIAGSAE